MDQTDRTFIVGGGETEVIPELLPGVRVYSGVQLVPSLDDLR